jgi:hypothetical protein
MAASCVAWRELCRIIRHLGSGIIADNLSKAGLELRLRRLPRHGVAEKGVSQTFCVTSRRISCSTPVNGRK